jgi:virginiamycin B lyase
MIKLVRITTALLALLVAACSSPGSSGGRLTPGTAQDAQRVSMASAGAEKLTGYYRLPSSNAAIFGMTNGPGRSVWFTEFQGDAIGKITTDGVVTTWPTATNAQPFGIALAPSRERLWTGGYGGLMIAVTPAGVQTNHPIAGAHIGYVLIGPDKNVWFTDYGNEKIGYVSKAGVATEFAMPPKIQPDYMAVGPDGNFWVTDGNKPRVLKVSVAGVTLANYGKGLSPFEYIAGIVAAPDGNMYLTEYADSFTLPDKIARITAKGKITEIGSLPPFTYPNNLAVGKDGNVYFSMQHLQAVGKIDTATAKVSIHYLPFTGDNGTTAIVNGPDNRLYLAGTATIYAVSY